MPKVGLFIPCYIDQFYPQVDIATLKLLMKFECDVSFPLNQTCCGQPMANSGFTNLSKGCDKNFLSNFSEFDYIVAPTGSCVLHIKEHLQDEANKNAVQHIQKNIFELTEFLTDVVKVENIDANFPHKIGLHTGYHGQRGLLLSSTSPFIFLQKKRKQLQRMVNRFQQ